MSKDFSGQHTRLTKEEAIELFPWLKKCDFEGGVFYLMKGGNNNYPIYEGGIWHSGIFQIGEMENCEFHSGIIGKNCTFRKGKFRGGIFNGLMMYDSNFEGTFCGGYFKKSNFINGTWDKGIFDSSFWHDGKITGIMRIRDEQGEIYETLPKKMLIRKRKVGGENRADIDSKSIEPETKETKRKSKLDDFFTANILTAGKVKKHKAKNNK